jgi:hypothetical protein
MVGPEEQVRPSKASVERMTMIWMETVACKDHRLISPNMVPSIYIGDDSA